MKSLRIAQISTLVEPVTVSSKNGLSQVVYYLTQELVELGHDVTLYAPMSSSTNAKLVALTDLDTAHETILGKVLPVAAAFADWRDFDIIHDHTRFYSTLFAHLLPVPIVSTVHHPAEFDELHWNYPADQYSAYFKVIWQRLVQSMHTVCVSEFQRLGFGEKAELIYNGIPLNLWPNPDFSAGEYLAFLGAINETKGTLEAIQATLLAEETIVIAGTTDEQGQYFRQSIRPFIDNGQVKYIGPLDFKEKWDFLAQAKAVLMPIQWDDPLPTVALESLAAGTPIIAWNRASMGEIIVDGESGFLVSAIEEMAARIKDIDKIDRRACRSRAALLFDSKTMARNYVNLYQRLLEA
jgi:glycosyltransferase involved in cell wall biosynthesis